MYATNLESISAPGANGLFVCCVSSIPPRCTASLRTHKTRVVPHDSHSVPRSEIFCRRQHLSHFVSLSEPGLHLSPAAKLPPSFPSLSSVNPIPRNFAIFHRIPRNSTRVHAKTPMISHISSNFLVEFPTEKLSFPCFIHLPAYISGANDCTSIQFSATTVFRKPGRCPMKPALNYVAHFKELEVYKRQRELARAVFQISNSFPAAERYSLTDQLRRASRSIGAQIAEAWAKRLYPKHFISKLSDADAEQMETQHWLTEANDCRYLHEADFRRLLGLCEEIGRMLGSMIQKADSFSSRDSILREDELPYLIDTDHRPLKADH
jgi:four helix bundle protein